MSFSTISFNFPITSEFTPGTAVPAFQALGVALEGAMPLPLPKIKGYLDQLRTSGTIDCDAADRDALVQGITNIPGIANFAKLRLIEALEEGIE